MKNVALFLSLGLNIILLISLAATGARLKVLDEVWRYIKAMSEAELHEVQVANKKPE